MALGNTCSGQDLIGTINELLSKSDELDTKIDDEKNELEELIDTKCKIYAGTYTGGGDGVTIPMNPGEIDFQPKLLVVGGDFYYIGHVNTNELYEGWQQATFCVPYGQTGIYMDIYLSTLIDIDNITWSEDAISWTGSGYSSANGSGHTYYYIIIG